MPVGTRAKPVAATKSASTNGTKSKANAKVVFDGLTEKQVKQAAKWIRQFSSLPENSTPQMVPYLNKLRVLAAVADLDKENVSFNYAVEQILMLYILAHDREFDIERKDSAVLVLDRILDVYIESPFYGYDLLRRLKAAHNANGKAQILGEFLGNLVYLRTSTMAAILIEFDMREPAGNVEEIRRVHLANKTYKQMKIEAIESIERDLDHWYPGYDGPFRT